MKTMNYADERKFKCPFCGNFLRRTVFLCGTPFVEDDDLEEDEDAEEIMSNGNGWVAIDWHNCIMCRKCQNIFNEKDSESYIDYGEESSKTIFTKILIFMGIKKEKELDYVISSGPEFYQKFYKEIKKGDDRKRFSIILRYIWEVESLSDKQKIHHREDYNSALSEIVEMLKEESRQLDDKRVNINKCLLLAEFYRRKGMFAESMDVLNKNSSIFSGGSKKISAGIMQRSKNKISELFHI